MPSSLFSPCHPLPQELENRGPNNTVLYAQRYYPDGYVLGDPFPVPSNQPRPQAPPQQQYEPQPQAAPPRQAFRGQAAPPRGPPAQFQPQQFQSQAPPQYQQVGGDTTTQELVLVLRGKKVASTPWQKLSAFALYTQPTCPNHDPLKLKCHSISVDRYFDPNNGCN